MAEDFGKDTAAPTPCRLGDRIYLVSKMGPRILGELGQFLKAFVPDPRLKAREICRDLGDKVALQAWQELSEEAKSWPPDPESPEGMQIFFTTQDGAACLIYQLLRRHNADVTPERARQLAEDITVAQLAELFRLSLPEPTFAPKSPGPAADRGPVPPSATNGPAAGSPSDTAGLSPRSMT